ncbi:hypothetical protein ALP00_200189 [Pseudomonas coronafaciens pv. porri]|nr:hypothetical protein ALP00_200189 [Pseudomonas coronafaciens pv. porri]
MKWNIIQKCKHTYQKHNYSDALVVCDYENNSGTSFRINFRKITRKLDPSITQRSLRSFKNHLLIRLV